MFSLRAYAPWFLFSLLTLYYWPHFRYLPLIDRFKKCRRVRWLAAFLLAAAVCAPVLANALSVWTITLAYLLGIWLSMDVIALISRLILPPRPRRIICRLYKGGAAILICLALMIGGYVNMHTVRQTNYTITTDKLKKPVTVALISDLHLGLSMDAEAFEKRLSEIAAQKPDILVLAGDLFDESTQRDEMLRVCALFRDFPARLGVFYVFGNHDAGRYNAARGFTGHDIRAAFTEANVHVLEDGIYQADGIAVVGRKEAGDRTRKSVSALLQGIDTDETFVLLIDHQPAETALAADAEVDLMLSGHTHNGQLFPLNWISEWFALNEVEYGREDIGNTAIIVSSGISGWGIPVRTCGRSEYARIDIMPAAR